MAPRSEESCRQRRVTEVTILIAVASGIALANLSSELVSLETVVSLLHNQESTERAYGWPLAWYWRTYGAQPYRVTPAEHHRPISGFWRNLSQLWQPRSPVARFSLLRLVANSAIWLTMLVSALVAGRWLLIVYGPIPRRLGLATIAGWGVIAALIFLANLSHDAAPEHGSTQQCSYGWPLIWCRYIDTANIVGVFRTWDYSTAALVGDFAAWLLIFAAAALAAEGLSRRYRLRPRWSLRTMLGGVALLAAICGWYVAARERADKQDVLVDWLGGEQFVYFESVGPKWLDVVGAGNLRRRIAGAYVDIGYRVEQADKSGELFKRLADLHSLRFLDVHPYADNWPYGFTPVMAATLGDMRELKLLNMDFGSDRGTTRDATRECLSAVGKLTQLERLRLNIPNANLHDLAQLSGLKNLKSLAIVVPQFVGTIDEADIAGKDGRRAGALARLPLFPALEELDLHAVTLSAEDLAPIAALPRLRSLNLCWTSIGGPGLRDLARLQSLERLAIDEDMATAAAFESFVAMKGLRIIHIAPSAYDDPRRSASLALDDGYQLAVLPSELNRLDRALLDLRQSRPEIVIDAQYDRFEENGGLEPPWLHGSRSIDSFVDHWIH